MNALKLSFFLNIQIRDMPFYRVIWQHFYYTKQNDFYLAEFIESNIETFPGI